MKVMVILSLAFLMSATATYADESQAIDMTKAVLNEKGQPMKDGTQATPSDPTCSKCDVMTVGMAINRALNGSYEDERGLQGDQKWARAALGARIAKEKAAHLTVSEAKAIELVVGKAYNGFVIGQIVTLIDPNKKVPELQ